MYYIYNKATSEILKNEAKYWQKAEYKTMSAAKAALTRMHKKFENKRFEYLKSPFTYDHNRPEAKAENSPLYTAGIAERDHYHKNIEKFEITYSMMDKEKKNPIRQSVNTPHYMDPASETYWSM